MALIISVLVLGLGAALVWGPERSVGRIETGEIGLIVMALGVIVLLASVVASRRATSEQALSEAHRLPERGWPRAATVDVEEAPDDEGDPFRPAAP